MAEPVANQRDERDEASSSSSDDQPSAPSASKASSPTSADPDAGSSDGTDADASSGAKASSDAAAGSSGGDANRSRRRRGSRGGRGRGTAASTSAEGEAADSSDRPPKQTKAAKEQRNPEELPEPMSQGRVRNTEAAERALVRRPQIGDTLPAPAAREGDPSSAKQRQDGRGDAADGGRSSGRDNNDSKDKRSGSGAGRSKKRDSSKRGGRSGSNQRRKGSGSTQPAVQPVDAVVASAPIELDDDDLERRRGRERKGRPVGRYLMAVSVSSGATQIAVFEGRHLIEHYVSRPADDITQIHGNVYLGKVQNVLPGMEAAFVDIGTPKNAVLYRGDVQYDAEDIEQGGANPRIEQILKAKQVILCQVTKNPIAHKGARLTQEVSLPGRFVVLIPNSTTYGISKRLSDNERKRLRQILDKAKPEGHGIIVRTAAENVTAEEIERDVRSLTEQWERIEAQAAKARKAKRAALLYREPDMAVRVIREEFNADYRGIIIDDQVLYEEIRDYVGAISPALADRVQFHDPATEPLPLFERHRVHEQVHKALDRNVWLPSGGSLVIEHTEALTVIDVNTGKNVGSSSLEETVFRNNLEAAEEIARQLRLRDIGGIIVIDFIDMEIAKNRNAVITAFRQALARDKTRTQVFDISELGLVEMTRKRIGEGLLESLSNRCPHCDGRGVVIDEQLTSVDPPREELDTEVSQTAATDTSA